MIDIVERLREIQHDGFGRPIVSSVIKAAGEAADLIERLRKISAAMAEDGGLWFGAETAAEAYVQQELRKLCAAIEGVSPDDCARAALEQKP